MLWSRRRSRAGRWWISREGSSPTRSRIYRDDRTSSTKKWITESNCWSIRSTRRMGRRRINSSRSGSRKPWFAISTTLSKNRFCCCTNCISCRRGCRNQIWASCRKRRRTKSCRSLQLHCTTPSRRLESARAKRGKLMHFLANTTDDRGEWLHNGGIFNRANRIQ